MWYIIYGCMYVYWFVYKTHFRHTIALASENVAVSDLMCLLGILSINAEDTGM